MERLRVEIGIGLRINASAEVVVRVSLRTDLRGKQRQGSIPPVNLRIADGRLLDADFGGVGDGILHAIVQSHYAVMPDLFGHILCPEISGQAGNDERHKNEYVKSCLHHTMIYHRAKY